MKSLKRGAKGPEVGKLQTIAGITVDDDFGPKTEQWVMNFQKANRLDPDGVVGPKTWAKLLANKGGNKPKKIDIKIPEVHLSKRGVTRDQSATRAFPLTEKDMPFSNGSPGAIHRIIDFLDVEKRARYKRQPRATYCNIYAYDFAYLMNAFLPRVFWYPDAIKSQKFTVKYASTVHEMNANSLSEWFSEYAEQFGWEKLDSTTQAQERANKGECVIMVAANKNRRASGHIVAVVPETDKHKSVGSGGIIIYPVQSQAGGVNRKYFASKWWGGHAQLRIYAHKGK